MNGAAWFLLGGLASSVAALALAVLVLLRPATSLVPRERRRPTATVGSSSPMARLGQAAVTAVDTRIGANGGGWLGADALEDAGIRRAPAEMMVLTIIASVVAGTAGWVLGGFIAALLGVAAAPVAVLVTLRVRAERRRSAFDDQLPDLLMTLAGSLRAGHSVVRALDGAAREFAAPMNEVLSRVVNEARVGRNLEITMQEAAARMRSEDFAWVAEAIRINREVGGDLARVLDQVGQTIRERAEIKGQVRALSAEGRISAYILIALPFALAAIMSVMNPDYVGTLVSHPIGILLLVVGALLIIIGSIVLHRMIRIEF
ncbi:type II secretion system F family protein [Zhihengliuella flava]|uniref:Tight adherence protein B n=1 Tax=Zhihengliuella flava TaxID=1285193 RepID=A0A931GMG9_9MICC|nr:type II secretion system F family protein [Zhihengliuella flava]MBG6085414.1 tight adherence protein B [Zhihengliuella flava]